MNRIVISIDFKTDLIDLFKGNKKRRKKIASCEVK